MPESSQFLFSHKEVATALLKAQGIHEGIWGLHVKFGLRAMNLGASDEDLQPSAVVPLMAIGLQQFEKVNNVAVDAAVVNPAPRTQKHVGTGKTKGARKRSK